MKGAVPNLSKLGIILIASCCQWENYSLLIIYWTYTLCQALDRCYINLKAIHKVV